MRRALEGFSVQVTGSTAQIVAASTRTLRTPVQDDPARSEGRVPPAGRGDRPWLRRTRPTTLIPLVSLTIWLFSLRHVPIDRMDDLGLLSVLPVTFWAALVLLTLGFAATLRRRHASTALFATYALSLIAILHATPALLYGSPRYSWTWKHAAVIDYLVRHGHTDPAWTQLTAYHRWPGFFALNTLLVKGTGLDSALAYATWAPPFFNVLMLGALILIFRSITRSRRIIWGAAWIFISAAWTGQDYFAPQAFAFFLYMVVLGILLARLPLRRGSRRGTAADPLAWESFGSFRGPDAWHSGSWGVVALLILTLTITTSHQLTPIMLIAALAALATPRAHRRSVLLLLVGAVTVTFGWDATVARSYIADQLPWLISAFGAVDSNTNVSMGTPSPGQVLIARVDRISSALVWTMTVLGVVRWRHLRRSRLLLLAMSPTLLLVTNDYGGEMILRVYLFTLPAAALVCAGFLLPWRRRTWLRAVAVPLALLTLLCGFAFGYYGKERMNYFPPSERAAAHYLYKHIPVGSLVVGVNSNMPDNFVEYDLYEHRWLAEELPPPRDLLIRNPELVIDKLIKANSRLNIYVILTRSQEAQVEMIGAMPAQSMKRLKQALDAAPNYTTLFRNSDAVIYRIHRAPANRAPASQAPVNGKGPS